jgi:resuscitation-promoting factor RpfB
MTALLTALILMLPFNQDARWKVVKPYNAKLERVARCEWGYTAPNWSGNTGNGYYGGLQFDLSTWQSVGGKGYPHKNSKLEQKYRAVKLIKRRGYRPWPRCGSA